MARRLLILAASALLLAGPACVDSEISGSALPPGPGGLDFQPYDVYVDDVPTPDGEIDADVTDPDVGCVSDDECQGVFTLGPCEGAFCSAQTGTCQRASREGCCASDLDCPEAAPCLAWFCPAPGATCQPRDTCGGGCQTDGECSDANTCTEDRCIGGLCAFPTAFAPNCCDAAPTFTTSFAPPTPFESESDREDVGWQIIDSALTSSPPAVLYLGNPDTGTYVSEFGPVSAEARLAVGDLAAGEGVEIFLQALLDVRPNPGADRFAVVLVGPGGAQVVVYTKGDGPIGKWHAVQRTVTVPVGGPWQLVLRFNQGGGNIPQRQGIFIDDITVKVGCGGGPACVNDSQCLVDDPCTAGRCDPATGQCAYEEIPGCCTGPQECPPPAPCEESLCLDGQCVAFPTGECCTDASQCPMPDDPCAVPLCVQGQCLYDTLPGCCVGDWQCPPPQGCTAWQCLDLQCQPTVAPGCCDSAAQCNDGNPCTLDSCQGGQCQYAPDPDCCSGDDCCWPDVYSQSFDGGGDAGFLFENAQPNGGWQVAMLPPDLVWSPPGALYYGDPDTLSFDFGASSGAATSPPIALPPASQGILASAWIYADIEPTPAYDQLRFVVVPEFGPSKVIWSKDQGGLPVQEWIQISTPLTAWSGQTVRLRVEFDTVDEVGNEGVGVLIDDLTITAQCGSLVCDDTGDCDDGLACTVDTCDLQTGTCVHQPLPSCCTSNAQCGDGDPCTFDVCDAATGQCQYLPNPNCCSPEMCDDGDPCTTDLCGPNGGCVNQPTPGCCSADWQCDDGIKCTQDLCDAAAGQCAHPAIPGCCTGDDECAPPYPCVYGWCEADTGTCQFKTEPGCCLDASDCIDGNACTLDVCNTPFCEWQPVAGCCQSDQDCQTGDPCVAGSCDPASGQCSFLPAPGCCESGAQCDDGDPCTVDGCDATGTCTHAPLTGCCATGADCDDGNKCTTDQCFGGQCEHQVDINCCDQDVDCDDGNGCTQDTCLTYGPFGICQYQAIPGPGCCINDSACAAGPPCTLGVCDDYNCSYAPDPACCGAGVDCNDGDPCTADLCVDGGCVHTQAAGCCSSDKDCVDGDPCTFEACDVAAQVCVSKPVPGCCANDGECEDGDPCTLNICGPDSKCLPPLPTGVCCVDGSCDDDNTCTDDLCDPTSGACFYTPISCDDGDPCTEDLCDPSAGCLHLIDPGCCGANGSCDDGDPCTTDICTSSGQCMSTPIPGCCQGDAACDDGDPCTLDACGPGNQCVTTPIPGCCTSDAACNDANPCTQDTCQGGSCVHEFDLNCCDTDAECDDGNACTQDTCFDLGPAGGICQYGPANAPGCCANASDCAVGPCESAQCVAFKCVVSADPSCCAAPGDCDDGDACTEDLCLGGACLNAPLPNCCQGDSDCNDGDPCTQDLCFDDGTCQNVPIGPGECVVDPDCEDGDPCTQDSCGACGQCSAAPVSCDDGDACTNETCAPLIGCVVTGGKLCNDNNPCTQDACDPATGACVHVPTGDCCTGDAQCDDGDSCTTDACVAGTCEHSDVSGCCNDDGDCDDNNPCSQDFCSGGSCQHDYDIFCCQSDPECDDGNVCTQDTCLTFQQWGICQYAPQPGPSCCISDTDCPAGPCQTATCDNYLCTYQTDPSCCGGDAECSDGDPCTLDACLDGVCVNTPSPDCCGGDADCDDGDDCTQDRCDASGKCVYQADPDCCQPTTAAAWSFEDGSLAGWTINPAQTPNEVTWWVSKQRAFAGGVALYMGNPKTLSYDKGNGQTPVATATSPPLTVPTTPFALLSFRVWLDVEPPPWDMLEVSVVPADGSEPVLVWTKESLVVDEYQAWPRVEIDLTPWAGQQVRLQWHFDALDGAVNETEGIYLDAIVVEGLCQAPGTCTTGGDCDDGDDCTIDTCQGGQCAWAPSTDPSCCKDETWLEATFDDGSMNGFEVFSDGGAAFWQPFPGSAMSPPFALYYGDPASMSYATGTRTFGFAYSQLVAIPSTATTPMLSFAVRVDVEPDPDRDRFRVVMIGGGNSVEVWSKAQLSAAQYGQWISVTVPMPAQVIGHNARVQFDFDSVDGEENFGEGLYVDDVRFFNACAP